MNGRRYWVAITATLLVACSGEIQPLGEVAGGSSGGGGSASGIAGSGGQVGSQTSGLEVCETPCFRSIVTAVGTGCKLCHNATVKLDMGTLDLESPGISARLKDEPAAHKGIASSSMGPTVCPQGDKLIDSAHPENSWLLKKVLGQQGTCGTQMPSTGPLPLADQACMATYVNCVADR